MKIGKMENEPVKLTEKQIRAAQRAKYIKGGLGALAIGSAAVFAMNRWYDTRNPVVLN